mgnify:CR=1 FL=1
MERFREVWFGNCIRRKYVTVREFIWVIHAKTPGLYQVPKLRNLYLIFFYILENVGAVILNGQSDLYYPLVADKNRVSSKIHLVGFRKPSFLLILSICT